MEDNTGGRLVRFTGQTYPPGPQKFSEDLLEQYRIACVAADNVSTRRESSNRYLITLNTAIVALYGFQAAGAANPYLLIPLAIAGLAISLLSIAIIKSHRALNQAKFEIILEIEEHLPAGIYAREWDLFKQRRTPAWRPETSDLEGYIHYLFSAIHVAAPTIIILLQR